MKHEPYQQRTGSTSWALSGCKGISKRFCGTPAPDDSVHWHSGLPDAPSRILDTGHAPGAAPWRGDLSQGASSLCGGATAGRPTRGTSSSPPWWCAGLGGRQLREPGRPRQVVLWAQALYTASKLTTDGLRGAHNGSGAPAVRRRTGAPSVPGSRRQTEVGPSRCSMRPAAGLGRPQGGGKPAGRSPRGQIGRSRRHMCLAASSRLG